MCHIHKMFSFLKDLFVHFENDLVLFFEGDFRSAVMFVVKEKIWGIIAGLMMVVTYLTYKGVQVAIAWNNDYAHTKIVQEWAELKNLYNTYFHPERVASQVEEVEANYQAVMDYVNGAWAWADE